MDDHLVQILGRAGQVVLATSARYAPVGLAAVPEALTPVSVKEYVKTNFPQEVITKIERRRSGVEVELANDYSLKFNSKGKFVGMDD